MAPVLVSILLLACYWTTLPPSITGGDAPELATAVHVMGVPHPTGYPLYLMLGKLFDLLPLGEPARRVAFFSAVCAAAAGGLLTWVLLLFTGRPLAGVLGGLLAGLNYWVWDQATQPEVYALHALLLVAALWAFVCWLANPGYRALALLAFVAGLGLAHHRTSLLVTLPLLVVAVWGTVPRSATALLRAAAWGLLPLLLYAWLPLRSLARPPLNWGNTSGSWQWLWWHVSGALYFGYAFHQTPARAWAAAMQWWQLVWQQLGPLGLALLIAGAGALLARRYRVLGACLLLGCGLNWAWATWYRVNDQQVFYLPVALFAALWCGYGFARVLAWTDGLALARGLRLALPMVAVLMTVWLPCNMALHNWQPGDGLASLDRSRHFSDRDAAALMLAGVPGRAALLLSGDAPAGYAAYWYWGLGHRPTPWVLPTARSIQYWCEPLLPDPRVREAAVRSREGAPEQRRHLFAYWTRALLPPEYAVYTNFIPLQLPEGYVLLRDYTLNRLARAPWLPETAVTTPGARAVLGFPGGVGALVSMQLPRSVERGRPFPVTAGIEWTSRVQPVADLELAFVHHSALPAFLASLPDTELYQHTVAVRPVPLFFGVAVPASAPGRHYLQRFFGLIGSGHLPGEYQVLVRLSRGTLHTDWAPAGRVAVR